MKEISVSKLVKYLKDKNDNDTNLLNVYICGEISNYKNYYGKNIYFDLKDNDATINVVMYNMYTNNLLFIPQNGNKVIVQGSVKVFKNKATFQIQATNITLQGIGELFVQFEKNKKMLMEKGYFSNEHKKKIPFFPKNIAVISGDSSAALHDVLKTLNSKYKYANIYVFTSFVQGEKAAQNIINNINLINKIPYSFDVIIIARGGGSFEDLNAFNDVNLALTVFNSNIPIISGVGHESDTTIIDYVADLRALTPTDAANKAVPNTLEILNKIEAIQSKIKVSFFNKYNTTTQLLDYQYNNISHIINNNINSYYKKINYYTNIFSKDKFYKLININLQNIAYNKMKIDKLIQNKIKYHKLQLSRNITNIINSFNHKYNEYSNKYAQSYTKLCLLDPKLLMKKGYAILYKDNEIIKDYSIIKPNDIVEIKNNEYHIISKVVEVNKNE
ncbi:MAG: exodeoxyribonuclease VII large subunit [Bacilli bacterium]|jgi:exodeoxyribonuclease VII large subunit|nr:exodeoxyribonuclease VII large subunit [Bacilli bacterium]